MDAARIALLLEPFLDRPLPAPALEQISIYIDLLLRWNARINLTSVRHPEQIVTRHFGESFFLARHLFPMEELAPSPLLARTLVPGQGVSASQVGASLAAHAAMGGPTSRSLSQVPHVLDLGSGAGFPGLPLKIWSPHIHLTLIESNHRKAAFLREAARSLTLTDINVIAVRGESLLSSGPPQADVVTLRAVERFDCALPLATRFLAQGARMAVLISVSQLSALPTLAPTIDWLPSIPVPQSHSRVLAIGVHSI